MNPDVIGDLLISFGSKPHSVPSRFPAGPWECVDRESEAGWELWACAPCPDWKGFPLYSLDSDGWKVYSLGEFRPPSDPHRLPQEIAAFHGRLLVFAWEAGNRRWHLWTDRFGTLHAYRAGRVVSTFSPAAAAFTDRRLDWPALAGFFGFGYFPGDHTHFEGLTILRPASHIILDERGKLVSANRYWVWRHCPNRDRSYDETVDEFGRVFETVMTEVFQEKRLAFPLSGGLDSRSTAAVVHPGDHASTNIWAYSYGYSADSVETGIAGRVAAKRGMPFRAFTIQPYLFDDLARVLAWTEGFQDITQPRQAFVRDEIATRADTLVAALWGDVWLDDMGLAGLPAGSMDPEALTAFALHKVEKKGRSWLLDTLCCPNLPGMDIKDLLSGYVRSELEQLGDLEEQDFRVKAFKIEQWSFRWSLAPVRVFQSAAWPRLVFYDTRLADFFATVPSEYLPGRRMQIDYLKRRAPDLARITWQVYDADLYHYTGYHTWQLPRRIIKKAMRMLNRKPVLQRNWEVQFLNPAGRKGLEHHLTRPGLRLHEFVSPARVKDLLDTFHARPDASNGSIISMLFTFSAWLEQYG